MMAEQAIDAQAKAGKTGFPISSPVVIGIFVVID